MWYTAIKLPNLVNIEKDIIWAYIGNLAVILLICYFCKGRGEDKTACEFCWSDKSCTHPLHFTIYDQSLLSFQMVIDQKEHLIFIFSWSWSIMFVFYQFILSFVFVFVLCCFIWHFFMSGWHRLVLLSQQFCSPNKCFWALLFSILLYLF